MSPKFDAVEWMADHGIPGYKRRIDELERRRWSHAFRLVDLEQQIEEIRREAQDRYEDWVTDPLE